MWISISSVTSANSLNTESLLGMIDIPLYVDHGSLARMRRTVDSFNSGSWLWFPGIRHSIESRLDDVQDRCLAINEDQDDDSDAEENVVEVIHTGDLSIEKFIVAVSIEEEVTKRWMKKEPTFIGRSRIYGAFMNEFWDDVIGKYKRVSGDLNLINLQDFLADYFDPVNGGIKELKDIRNQALPRIGYPLL